MRKPKEKSEEEIQEYKENRERLQNLMDIITQWQVKEPEGEALKEQKPPYRRMFMHLSDDMLIKEVAITPRTCSMSMLMTFLATEILEMYPWEKAGRKGKSRVYINNIIKALSKGERVGDSHNYNCFYYKKLEECFLPEENRKSAQRLSYIRKHGEGSLLEKAEGEGLDGFRLMEEIRSKVRRAMSEYWKSCENNQELKEEEKEKKKRIYEKCLMAVALHEIYLREYYGSWEKRGESYKLYAFFLTEHLIGLYAEIQIIMLLERLHYQGGNTSKLLECFEERNMVCDFEIDKNKGKLYKRLDTYIKELLHQMVVTEKIDFFAALEEYFLMEDDKEQQEKILSLEYAIGKKVMLIMHPAISYPVDIRNDGIEK